MTIQRYKELTNNSRNDLVQILSQSYPEKTSEEIRDLADEVAGNSLIDRESGKTIALTGNGSESFPHEVIGTHNYEQVMYYISELARDKVRKIYFKFNHITYYANPDGEIQIVSMDEIN